MNFVASLMIFKPLVHNLYANNCVNSMLTGRSLLLDSDTNPLFMNRSYLFIFFSSLLFSCMGEGELVRLKYLPNYSSASAVEFHNDTIFIMGDDAPYALLLNTKLDSVGRIDIVPFNEKRINKAIKHDIESSAIINDSLLIWLGSGSMITRNKAWRYHLKTGDTIQIDLSFLYEQLSGAGIKELNIEGVVYTPQLIILANRGSLSYPKNELIFLNHNFLDSSFKNPIRIVKAGFQPLGADGFVGLSGLSYSGKYDRVFAVASTERTKSKVEDGEIGKSYLWIFDDISTKRNFTAINPSRIVDLNAIDPRFESHKIESVTILEENEQEVKLLLVADDDNGTSTIFIFKTSNLPVNHKGSSIWDL